MMPNGIAVLLRRFISGRFIQAFLGQALHSGVTLFINIWFMRHTSVDVFAVNSALFLVAMIFAGAAMQWVTQLWFQGFASDISVSAVAIAFASLVVVIFYVYGFFVGLVNPAFLGVIGVFFALIALFTYLCGRRLLLLSGSYTTVMFFDAIRMAASLLIIWNLDGLAVSVADYVLWIVLAHSSIFLFFIVKNLFNIWRKGGRAWKIYFLNSYRPELSKNNLAVVVSEQLNSLFSQASSLLAPAVIGVQMFATSRAYETYLVFVMFFIQSLDPYYSRIFRGFVFEKSTQQLLSTWSTAALILSSPVIFLCAAQLLLPPRLSPVTILIPIAYVEAKDLFWGVCGVAFLMAFCCPGRWFLYASGDGKLLMAGTILVSSASLLLMISIVGFFPAYWVPVSVNIFYELCMFFVCIGIVVAIRRRVFLKTHED